MSHLEVCRVCLCTDVKMYNMSNFKLKMYYEEIITEKVQDELPRYFCYECATLLYKYHKFREKCFMARGILKNLEKMGPISLSSILQVNRVSNNLISTIKLQPKLTLVHISILENDSLESHIKTEENTIALECDKDILKNEYQEETLAIDNLKTEEEIDANQDMDCIFDNSHIEFENIVNDKSPTVIVVDENKSKIKQNAIKNKTIRNKRGKGINSSKSIKTERRKGGMPKRTPLDPQHWLKISLNEEQALKNFKQRANDLKYLKAVYKCELCYYTFSTQEIMDRHMKLNHCESRGLHKCHFCHKRFKIKCLVTQHIVVHYNQFKCLRCNLTFNSEHSASNHNIFHSGVMLPCKHCGLEFRHKTSYYSHLRIYHRSEYVCPLCGEAFVSSKGLRQHKLLKHLNAQINHDENKDQNTYCERCEIKFETQKAYQEHFQQSLRHADDFQIHEDREQVGTSDVPAPLKGGATKTFSRVNSSRPTTCPVCGNLFRSYSQYVKHHRSEHKGVPYNTQVCEICGATVKGGAIGIHMNIHTKQKIYSCSTCGAQFHFLTSFTRHQLTHTGEKPYKCPLCEKRFTQKTSMQLHHRTFHLKQPYPKRIRKKENVAVQENKILNEYSNDYRKEYK